jgi:hypothetical protein
MSERVRVTQSQSCSCICIENETSGRVASAFMRENATRRWQMRSRGEGGGGRAIVEAGGGVIDEGRDISRLWSQEYSGFTGGETCDERWKYIREGRGAYEATEQSRCDSSREDHARNVGSR